MQLKSSGHLNHKAEGIERITCSCVLRTFVVERMRSYFKVPEESVS
jgi:hypothetical protein